MPLTEKGRKLIEEMNQEALGRDKEREKFTPPCPRDGLPGFYIGTLGSYDRGFLVYKCPNDDQFTFDSENNLGYPLAERYHKNVKPRNDQGATPRVSDAK